MPNDIEDVIEQLEEQVEELCEQEQYEEAIAVSQRICALALQHYGYEHQDYATTLSDLAGLYQTVGAYDKAEQFYLQAIRIDEFALGKETTGYASDLQDLARLYREMGKGEEAVRLYKQSLQIELKALGPEHPGYRRSLQELETWLKQSNHRITGPMVKQAALSPTAEIEQRIVALGNEAVTLYRRGLYDQATEFALQACNLAESYLNEEHPHTATSLNNLAILYQAQGNYAEAEPLYQRALAIDEQALGAAHPHTAASLNNLAELYRAQGNYAEAEPLYQRALAICEQALGAAHPHTAASLNNLAKLYQAQGNYAEAEPLLQRALAIDEQALGVEHPDTATSLNNLAAFYDAQGNYAEAEPLYQRALAICEQALGAAHPHTAASLNNLAAFYDAQGNYAEAEPLYQRALAICEQALGAAHPHTATSLNNLAELYRAQGNYAEAEPLSQRALAIYEQALGAAHPATATSLNNLAALYHAQGNYAEAEPLLQRALAICEQALGAAHPDTSMSLNNLAALYQTQGNYAEAEPLYQRALAIREQALGAAHPDTATSLNNLAALYQTQGNYAEAEPLYQRALAIREQALGAAHPDTAGSLNNLAALYQAQGNYAEAEPLHQRALAICERALGAAHPDTAGSLRNLAGLLVARSQEHEALPLFQRALEIDERMLGQIFSISSEKQRAAFLKTQAGNFAGFLSLVYEHLSKSQDAVRSALALVLRRKAIEAEALTMQRDMILGGKYPALEPQLRALTVLRRQIAEKTLAGPGAEGLATYEKLLADWNQQKEKLEAKLARQVPEMNLEQKLRAVDRQAVALALPEGSTFVEFVRFDVFDHKAVPARGEAQWKPARYLAFVLPANEPDNVQMIDLGEAQPIDKMIATFRDAIIEEAEGRGKRDLGSLPSATDHLSDNVVGTALYQALFPPKLLDAIDQRTRLLLSPDGDLSRLPFEVLPLTSGRRLIDAYHLSYVGAGRDVLRFGAASSGQATDAIVAADPDFDLSTTIAAAQTATAETSGHRSRALDRSDLHFGRLPGTRIEGERIAAKLKVTPWLTNQALEARLKACRSPRILHLATHGFFLEDEERDLNQMMREWGLLQWHSAETRLSAMHLENPLLRSGLALAGANTWLQQGHLPAEAEDGILTAEDVTGLDLLDTELVVLSACETGLGEIRTGEGVFGLRRAFVIAGARTLVMSLWKVPDLATAILMERMYDNLLEKHLARSEALREAQFYLRKVTVGEIRATWLTEEMIERLSAGSEKAKRDLQKLAVRPDTHCPFELPFYWGAFICQGEPSPLPSQVSGS